VDGLDHSQGYNRMSYVRNNPGGYIDPSGFGLTKNTEPPDGQNGGLIWQSSAARTVYGGAGYQEAWYIGPDGALDYLGRIYDSFSNWFALESFMESIRSSAPGRGAGGGGQTANGGSAGSSGTDGQAPAEEGDNAEPQGQISCDQDLIDIGNKLAGIAEDVGTVSGILVALGVTATVGGTIAQQPEVAAVGVAVAGTGGAGGIAAGSLQAMSGVFQGLGGAGYSNTVNALVVLGLGQGVNAFIMGRRLAGPLTYRERLEAASRARQVTYVGGGYDALTAAFESLGPQQMQCMTR
jgi:hypothetical protein